MITGLSSELRVSAEQLETVQKELATERQNFFYLNRALEEVVEQVHHREKSRWRRALSLLLTIVLSAVVGAASFAVFLWLYYRGFITLD